MIIDNIISSFKGFIKYFTFYKTQSHCSVVYETAEYKDTQSKHFDFTKHA